MSVANDKARRDLILANLEANIPKEFVQDQWQGDFTPDMLGQLAEMSPSAMENVALDPRLRAAQMDVLQRLQSMGQSGYDDIDRAAIQQSMDQAARQEQGQRAALMQNMQARGMGGSGAELAAQLANQQGAANRNSIANSNIAAEGRRRALMAMTQGAGLAGNMENSDFARQAQIAAAKDRINEFNTRNTIAQQQYNNQLGNQARLGNQQGRQDIASRNAQGQNQFNQQQFGNRQGVAQVQYNAATNDINNQMARDAEKKRKQAAMAGAVGSVAGGVVGGMVGGPAGASVGANAGNTLFQNWG